MIQLDQSIRPCIEFPRLGTHPRIAAPARTVHFSGVYDGTVAIRNRYETDARLCEAFVDGLMSECPTPKRAREAVGLYCLRNRIDGALLRTALESALTKRGEGAA